MANDWCSFTLAVPLNNQMHLVLIVTRDKDTDT